jgi:hypothetical protein
MHAYDGTLNDLQMPQARADYIYTRTFTCKSLDNPNPQDQTT